MKLENLGAFLTWHLRRENILTGDFLSEFDCPCWISCQTWKRIKMLFFHLLDTAILNSYILLPSCGGKKISHGDFQLALLRNMMAEARQQQWLDRPVGRPPTASVNISRLDTSSISTGLVQWRQDAAVCAVWEVWQGKRAYNISSVMWPYAVIKCVLWIITQRSDCKILHMLPLYTNLKPGNTVSVKQSEFSQFLDTYFVYLGNKHRQHF